MIKYFCFFLLSAYTQSVIAAVQLPVPDSQDEALKIVQLDKDALVYYDGKGLGLMNLSGQRLSAANYFSIHPLQQSMYAVQMQEGGMYGIMNAAGKLITPVDYTEISSFSEFTTRVQRKVPVGDNSEKTEYAIISNDGLILSDWMDSISSVSGDDYRVFKHQGKWGIVRGEKKTFFDHDFEDIGVFNAGWAAAKYNDKWGYIRTDGEWWVKPVFEEARQFEGRYAPVRRAYENWQLLNRATLDVYGPGYDSIQFYENGAYGFIYRGGQCSYLGLNAQELTKEWYDDAGLFSGNNISKARRDSSYYYVNILGEEIFHADSLYEFDNGRGIFRKDRLWGWVNDDGEIIAEPAFDEVMASAEKYLIVRKGTGLFLVDAKGKTVQEIHAGKEDVVLTNSALIYGVKPSFYLVDLLKSHPSLLRYDEAGDISSGVIVVRKDSLYGYVDVQGKEIAAPENVAVSLGTEKLLFVKQGLNDDFAAYDKNMKLQFHLEKGLHFLGPYKEARAKVINQSGLMGFVDEQGKSVSQCRYALVGDFQNGRAIFRSINGLYGYLDADGKEVIPATYKFVSDFDAKGYAAVIKDKLFGFIHVSGNVVVPFQYDNVLSLNEGIASVEKDGKVGYINMQNKKIIPFTFDEAFQVREDLALVRMGVYWGYINAKGKVEIPWQFAGAQAFSEGKAWVRLEEKYGAVNTKGAYLIPFKYENATPFRMGYARVQYKGKWGLVDQYGVEIIPPVCDNIGEVYRQKVVAGILTRGYGIKYLK